MKMLKIKKNSDAPSCEETLDDEEIDNECTNPLTKRGKKNENAPDKSPMNFFQKTKSLSKTQTLGHGIHKGIW